MVAVCDLTLEGKTPGVMTVLASKLGWRVLTEQLEILGGRLAWTAQYK